VGFFFKGLDFVRYGVTPACSDGVQLIELNNFVDQKHLRNGSVTKNLLSRSRR